MELLFFDIKQYWAHYITGETNATKYHKPCLKYQPKVGEIPVKKTDRGCIWLGNLKGRRFRTFLKLKKPGRVSLFSPYSAVANFD